MDIDFKARVTMDKLESVFLGGQLTDTLGVKFTEIGKDYLKATLTVDERHLRPGRIMNGGVSLALIEIVGSTSAACAIDFGKQNGLGIQVNANHLSVARPGDTLTATSKPVHIGRSTHVWEVTIENQDGKPVSSGRITLMVMAQS